MRILVTGSEGLLGSAIFSLETDHILIPCSRTDADLRNFEDVKRVITRAQPDAIIHAAAVVGGIGGNQSRSAEFFFENMQINLNVLEAAKNLAIKDVVSFMSTCVFPNQATYPLTANQLHLGPPHESNFGYAYSKRMLEVQSRSYNLQWGCRFKVLVPANMYGPGDNFSLEDGHVVPALLHKVLLAKRNNQELEIWGSGNPLREFVYSKDVAKVVLSLVGEDFPSPLIISNGVETSIRDLVNLLVKVSGFQGQIRFDESKPDGQYRKPSSMEQLEQVLPSSPFTSLEEGLKETWTWFESRYPRIRM